MPDGDDEPLGRAAQRDANHRDAAWHRKLAELRGIYLETLACTDARVSDPGFLRSRASLGAILRALGALPERPTARPGCEPGSTA
jgi:hypothetical protein